MNDLNLLRKQIRQIISEMTVLSESQKTPEIDAFVNSFFGKSNFFVSGKMVTDEVAKRELSMECTSELKLQVNQAQSGEFAYENLYVLKLSDFLLRTPEGFVPLTFEDPEASSQSIFKEISTSFVIYAYHDTLFKMFPYNEEKHSDAKLEAEAAKFLSSPEFGKLFDTRTQRAKFTGEIKVLDFGRRVRVYSDYFNPKSKEEDKPKEKTPFAKSKKTFRPNSPLIHRIFGKGVIKTTKKVKEEPDGDVYNLEVDFPGYGIKKIQMKAAA